MGVAVFRWMIDREGDFSDKGLFGSLFFISKFQN